MVDLCCDSGRSHCAAVPTGPREIPYSLVSALDPATLERLRIEGDLENLEETCVLIGYNPPKPCKKYERVFVIGDCAKAEKEQGKFIAGCPPLPSIQIVHEFKKMSLKKDEHYEN